MTRRANPRSGAASGAASRRKTAKSRQRVALAGNPAWKRRLPRLLALAAAGTVAALVLGVLGFRWIGGIPLRDTRIEGSLEANEAALLVLAGLDSVRYLFDVDPSLTADRLRRHPWVREARVSRRPQGTLSIRIQERRPVLLLSTGGQPVLYLDAGGFPLPLGPGQDYDVPVVHAVVPGGHATRRIESPGLLRLAGALSELDLDTRRLISEFVMTDDGVRAYTIPTPGGRSVPVELGNDRITERLRVLEAFWRQQIAGGQVPDINQIDLRFEGQVIVS